MKGFIVGFLSGAPLWGLLAYLYAQRVINSAQAAAKAFDQPPHH